VTELIGMEQLMDARKRVNEAMQLAVQSDYADVEERATIVAEHLNALGVDASEWAAFVAREAHYSLVHLVAVGDAGAALNSVVNTCLLIGFTAATLHGKDLTLDFDDVPR
jgi:hypothetical protein